jgi:hypothetical protein
MGHANVDEHGACKRGYLGVQSSDFLEAATLLDGISGAADGLCRLVPTGGQSSSVGLLMFILSCSPFKYGEAHAMKPIEGRQPS